MCLCSTNKDGKYRPARAEWLDPGPCTTPTGCHSVPHSFHSCHYQQHRPQLRKSRQLSRNKPTPRTQTLHLSRGSTGQCEAWLCVLGFRPPPIITNPNFDVFFSIINFYVPSNIFLPERSQFLTILRDAANTRSRRRRWKINYLDITTNKSMLKTITKRVTKKNFEKEICIFCIFCRIRVWMLLKTQQNMQRTLHNTVLLKERCRRWRKNEDVESCWK